jgi:hypothetical protein
MITRIELTNFMSHVHTVIEPAAGLTVLLGPNNCGSESCGKLCLHGGARTRNKGAE